MAPASSPSLPSGEDMESYRKVSIIAMDGHELVSLALPGSATVEELQRHVFEASGTSPQSQRLVLGGRILPPASSLAAAGVEDRAQLTLVVTFPAVEYLVMQGVVLKKPGLEASAPKVVKLQRPVGSKIRTTGQTWTGPGGGEWVEVDPSAEKPGWILIRGPGFGSKAPLLQEVLPGEEEPHVMRVLSPVDDEDMREICLKPSWNLRQVKYWISVRLPGLRQEKLIIVKKRPNHRSARFTPGKWILEDDVILRDTPFNDGDELPYLYMGDPEDYVGEPMQRQDSASNAG